MLLVKIIGYEYWQNYATQVFAAFIATIVFVSDGMHYGWPSPVLFKFQSGQSPFEITGTDKEWIELLYLIGGLVGLPLALFIVNRFGRKKSILLAAFSNLLAWILIAVANHVAYLYVARLLAGITTDVAFVAAPMYISEMAHKKIRGFVVSFIFISSLAGVLICYSVFPFVSVITSSCVGACFVIFQLIAFPFVPETPYLHLLKNNPEEAAVSLRWFRRSDAIAEELAEIKLAVERQSQERGRFQDLYLVKSNRKAIIIACVLYAGIHLSSISVILMNLHSILREAEGIIETNTTAIIFSVIMLISAVTSSLIVDKFGRKVLLITSSMLSSLALGTLAIYLNLKHRSFDVFEYNWVPIAAVFLYAGVFRFGLGTVSVVIAGEIFPTSVKAKGIVIAGATYSIVGSLTVYMYQALENTVGNDVPFFIFSASCVFIAVFVAYCVPETKGKTLEQIQMILKGEKKGKEPKINPLHF